MSDASVSPTMVLLVMMILLVMMLLVCLMRVLVGHVHLHISLMTIPSVHHNMLPLLVALVEHPEMVLGGRLRDRRAGG